MRKGKKLLSVLSSVALLVGLVAGCGGSPESNQSATPANGGGEKSPKVEDTKAGESVELRMVWWGSQNRHDRTLKVIEMFEKENPGVKIKPEFSGWDGYWEKLATQVAGNRMPDIVQMDYKFLNEYVDRDTLLDLNPYVEQGVLDLSDTDDNYIGGGKIDGKLFAVSLGANSPAIAYDPELFKKAGVELKPGYTWEEFANIGRQIKEKTGTFGIEPFSDLNGFKHYLRNHGLWVYNEQGNALGYDDDKYLVEYFHFFKDLIDEGVAAPAEQWVPTADQVENRMMTHGTAAMGQMHSNQITAVMSSAGRPMEVTILPSIEGGEKGHFFKPSQFLSVAKTTKHPEMAAKFIDYVTNNIEANDVLAGERGLPIAKKVRDHLKEKADESGKKMYEYMELVEEYAREIDPPDPKGATEIEALFERIVQEVDYGQSTPEDAAKKFRNEATAILKKNNG